MSGFEYFNDDINVYCMLNGVPSLGVLASLHSCLAAVNDRLGHSAIYLWTFFTNLHFIKTFMWEDPKISNYYCYIIVHPFHNIKSNALIIFSTNDSYRRCALSHVNCGILTSMVNSRSCWNLWRREHWPWLSPHCHTLMQWMSLE